MQRPICLIVAAACLAIAQAAVCAEAADAGQQAGVELAALKTIRTDENAPAPVTEAAKILQAALKSRYQLDLPVVEGGYRADEPAIFVGRGVAAQAGMITEAELEAVRFDGHVIKASGGRIALAAQRPGGTIFAAYRLLENLGLKRYSGGRELPFVEVFLPLEGGRLPPLAVADKPFFEYRSVISHVSRGACGESYNDVGDPQMAANQDVLGKPARKDWLPNEWLGGDHTAAYLVTKQLYYDEHPEYFAWINGKRLPKSTLMQRMSLCLSRPDVVRLSRERMVEWMGMQSDRRFFYCTDADSGPCQCPDCRALDPLHSYNTDRYLGWVNAVARAAGEKHPDNRLFALAYVNTTKPPVREGLEPNVIALYCPWFWLTVGNRTHTFSHPKNHTAMEELAAWLMEFPGQMGIYDYPGAGAYLWLHGMEMRIKAYARSGIRAVYCCGTPLMFDGLFHHVVSWQLWDPFADTGDLRAEYVLAAYGPAAGAVTDLLRFNDRVWDEGLGDPTVDAELMGRFDALLQEVMRQADGDADARRRLRRELLVWLRESLQASNPRKAVSATPEDVERFRRRVLWYVETLKVDAAEHKAAGRKSDVSRREGELAATLRTLGIDAGALLSGGPAGTQGPQEKIPAAQEKTPAAPEELIDRTIANPDAIVGGIETAAKAPETPAPPVAVIAFSKGDGAAGWEVRSPAEGVVAEVAAATLPDALRAFAAPGAGVRMTLPLTRLPVRRIPIAADGRNDLHAGWFAVRKTLVEPVDASGRDAVELLLHASCALPLSVVLAMEGAGEVRSDVLMHAGVGLVRVDLNAHAQGRWPRAKWTGRITAVSLVFRPQDNVYPYPAVKDAVVTLLGVTARRGAPRPADLPWAGRAALLAQVRPNIPHDIPPELAIRGQGHDSQPPDGWTERFRTWTDPRIVSPLTAICTAAAPSPGELEVARLASEYLRRLTGVTLPVNPEGVTAGPDADNVVIVGRRAALAAGVVTERELAYAGDGGFVLRARDGRIVLAGTDDMATLIALARYMEDHGAKFLEPVVREIVPDLRGGFLHEVVDFDGPYFAGPAMGDGWKAIALPAIAEAAAAGRSDAASALALAAAIKRAARAGGPLTPDVLRAASASPLNHYVASRLTWNPFLDATGLIEEFAAPR
jgi:hypothetical protein